MFEPRLFLKEYLSDHFLYKTATLKNILDGYPDLKEHVLDGLIDIEDDKYEQTLRAEVRATTYQAAETLFELIFALSPRDGQIDNLNIWSALSSSDWRSNNRRIGEIANGEVAFLDQVVLAGHNADHEPIEEPLAQYIFYFGETNPEIVEQIPESIGEIKRFLIVLAKEFNSRGEYNALKHTMRIFPSVSNMFVRRSDSDDEPWARLLDMTGSMSYLEPGKDQSISIHAVPMDSERDHALTIIAAGLISNIVRSRHARLGRHDGYDYRLLLLREGSTANEARRRKPMVNFTFTMTPVLELPDADSE